MDWQQIAPDFKPDGSLRDIYVFGTGLSDWQRTIDALRVWDPSPTLAIGGQLSPIPDKIEDIFAAAREQGALLSVKVSGVLVNCHFFGHDDIEFDIDPREVTGPIQLDGVEGFMAMLGQATGKPVVMTMENSPEAVILRYAEDTHRFEWVPPKGR